MAALRPFKEIVVSLHHIHAFIFNVDLPMLVDTRVLTAC